MAGNGEVRVRITYGALAKQMMSGKVHVIEEAQRAGIRRAGPFVQRALSMNTPVGATGKARQSVIFEDGHRPDTGFVTYAAPASSYIGFANDGTRPHRPPFGPIALWAKRKGLPAGAVWRSIARKGTRAQKFVERTTEQVRSEAQRLMALGVSETLRRYSSRR